MNRTDGRTGKQKTRKSGRRRIGIYRHALLILRRERVPDLVLLTLLCVILGAIGFYYSEPQPGDAVAKRIIDAIWWAFVTVTTVGYGDITPKTVAGRIVGIALMFSGVVLLSLITAIIASILVERKIREEKGLESIVDREHLILCGWNEYAEDILNGIAYAENFDKSIILINEMDEEEITEIKFKFHDLLDVKFIRGDFTHESVLARANVEHANHAIIVADLSENKDYTKADEKVILGTLAIKSANPRIKVHAELLDKANRAHLKRANADEIVLRGELSGFFLASSIVSPGLPEVMQDILDFEKSSRVKRSPIPQRFVGRPCAEVFNYFKNEENATLIGVINESRCLGLDDILSHDTSAIDKFIQQKFAEAGELCIAGMEQVNVNVNPPNDYEIRDGDLAVVIVTE